MEQINERVSATSSRATPLTPIPYSLKTVNGELPPWRLRPRSIPLPESSPVAVNNIHACQSPTPSSDWLTFFDSSNPLILPAGTSHSLDIQAEVHSTAFTKWIFSSENGSEVKLRLTYSEGYELDPRQYPWLRTKGDRLDSKNGHLLGPYDEVTLQLSPGQSVIYEPFWFRTFRLIRVQIEVGDQPIKLVSFEATQVNYPMGVKAEWKEPAMRENEKIWEVSIRTLRNCMFDGYSDCPFYEQLQYALFSQSVLRLNSTLTRPFKDILVTVDLSGYSITFFQATTVSCVKQLQILRLQSLPKASPNPVSRHTSRKSSPPSPSTGSYRYPIIIYTLAIHLTLNHSSPRLMVS